MRWQRADRRGQSPAGKSRASEYPSIPCENRNESVRKIRPAPVRHIVQEEVERDEALIIRPVARPLSGEVLERIDRSHPARIREPAKQPPSLGLGKNAEHPRRQILALRPKALR